MRVLRKITSLILVFSFFVVTFSSVGLDIAHGSHADRATWSLLGVNIGGMQVMHSVFGYLMLALIILHCVFNLKPIIAYIKKNKSSWLPSKAALFTAVFSAALFVFSIIDGSNNQRERKPYTENNVSTYELSENDNRPAQY